MGVERKSMILSDEEEATRRITRRARPGRGDDSGHRSAAQGHDHSRGMALGLTMQLPE